MQLGPYKLNEVRIPELMRHSDKYIGHRAKEVKVAHVERHDREGRRVFQAWSDDGKYWVTIAADDREIKKFERYLTKGNRFKLEDLDLKFSCTCPAFLYWGSDYWAAEKGWLDTWKYYVRDRSKGRKPNERDPQRDHLLCKHVWAVYDQYKGKEL